MKRTNQNSKWGIINDKNEIIIPCIYDMIEEFEGNFAVVTIENKKSLINMDGKLLLEPSKHYEFQFIGEYVCVKKHETQFIGEPVFVKKKTYVGLIDNTGYLISPYYSEISILDDFFLVKNENNRYGIFNKSGDKVLDFKYDQINHDKENKVFYLNIGGGLITKYSFGEEYISFDGGNWGISSESGQIILPIKFDAISKFRDGLFCINIKNKYGYYDKEGNEIIFPVYDEASDFTNGLAKVKLNGKYGYINKKGEVIIEIKFDFISEVCQDICIFSIGGSYEPDEYDSSNIEYEYKGGKYGLVNTNGELVLEAQYLKLEFYKAHYILPRDFIIGITREEWYGNEKYESKILLNFQGKIIFHNFQEIELINDNLYAVTLSGSAPFASVVIINRLGVIQNQTKFNHVRGHFSDNKLETTFFFDGLCCVRLDENYFGFINEVAKLAIEPKYNWVYNFKNGFCIVNKGGRSEINEGGEETFGHGKWGVINKDGVEVIPIIYDKIEIVENSTNLFKVNIGGKWSVDEDRQLYCFYGGKWSIVNETGVLQKPFE